MVLVIREWIGAGPAGENVDPFCQLSEVTVLHVNIVRLYEASYADRQDRSVPWMARTGNVAASLGTK